MAPGFGRSGNPYSNSQAKPHPSVPAASPSSRLSARNGGKISHGAGPTGGDLRRLPGSRDAAADQVLLGEQPVGRGAGRLGIVLEDGLPLPRRLGQAGVDPDLDGEGERTVLGADAVDMIA